MGKKPKHPQEFFEITKIAKKFDRTSNTFDINISYKTATTITLRTLPVAEAFGIGVDQKRLTTKQLNQEFSIISRVVLHPKYRAIGLGARLVKETLSKVGTKYVEAIAVMARCNQALHKRCHLSVRP